MSSIFNLLSSFLDASTISRFLLIKRPVMYSSSPSKSPLQFIFSPISKLSGKYAKKETYVVEDLPWLLVYTSTSQLYPSSSPNIFFFLNIFFESTDVKPNVSAALESAVLIRLFEKIMSHTIPTTNNTGMTIEITSLIISLYKRIAINVCSLLL